MENFFRSHASILEFSDPLGVAYQPSDAALVVSPLTSSSSMILNSKMARLHFREKNSENEYKIKIHIFQRVLFNNPNRFLASATYADQRNLINQI